MIEKKNGRCESSEGGDAYGQQRALSPRPSARASTSRHKGDDIPGAGREEQQQGVGEGVTMRKNPPKHLIGFRGKTENGWEPGCRNNN